MRLKIGNRHRWMMVFLALGISACVRGGYRCPCDSDKVAAPTFPLVLLTDFSLRDGAVSAMRGVAYQVDPHLYISDLTHEVTPYNIWEAAFRLNQTYLFWPSGTVFVTVVDPGVGSARHSIAVRAKSGQIFVGPDNGLFTLVSEGSGLSEVRVIDEARQRRQGSAESYTFHGRDLYVYVGAQLASGKIKLEDLGPLADKPLVQLGHKQPQFTDGKASGLVNVLDPNYGNVWTDIPKTLITNNFGNTREFNVTIFHAGKKIYVAKLPLVTTFSAVPIGQPLLYFNSLLNLSVALNQGDFAKKHKIGSGPEWTFEVGGTR